LSAAGNIESFAYCPSLGGWLILGWFGFGWDAGTSSPGALLSFGETVASSEPVVCTFERADVRKVGSGVVIFVPDQADLKRNPYDLTLRHGEYVFQASMLGAQRADQQYAINHALNLITHAPRSQEWQTLIAMLDRPLFTGADTLDAFNRPVFMQVDLAFICPPHGLWLFGWTLDPFETVKKMMLRCGSRSVELDPREWISISRSDVRDGFAANFGGLNAKCGFLAYVPDVYVPGQASYIEIETIYGEVGFKSMAAVRSAGIDTIKDLLGRIDLRYDELVRGYDNVIGPAISAINKFRLRERVDFTRIDFGQQPKSPRCSVIVPLFGRMDFMEYQLAFFSQSLARDHEVIYVLDDPLSLRHAEFLAASCFARFQHPFTLVTLSDNVGYAPANNVGLSVASGEFVCFLNSDVFPDEPDWLECMLETAAADSKVGVVGALLLFEDGTVQHDGCSYERLFEFGNWVFCQHPDKGMTAPPRRGIHEVSGVTGACFVMETKLARELGGFDEGYVIGDFEDADLCEKVKATGKICVVDRRACLYHLERQSQGNQQASWRFNLTLYNAWRFQNRWAQSGVLDGPLVSLDGGRGVC
jgi:GT2 family glycosyltransferase